MANARRRRFRHDRVISVPAAQRAAANAWAKKQTPSWGDDFFSFPLYGKDGKVTEYAADCPFSDEMLRQLAGAPKAIFAEVVIEKLNPKLNCGARLAEIAAKRNLDVRKPNQERAMEHDA